jgi:hypothetical protein
MESDISPSVPIHGVVHNHICGMVWVIGDFPQFCCQPRPSIRHEPVSCRRNFPAVYFPLFDIAALSLSPTLFLAIFPLHGFATFCLFYVLYFVSKSLVLAEKAAPVEFPNYIGTLFLIWFFPIGVWFTQPRINRLYANAAPTVSS